MKASEAFESGRESDGKPAMVFKRFDVLNIRRADGTTFSLSIIEVVECGAVVMCGEFEMD